MQVMLKILDFLHTLLQCMCVFFAINLCHDFIVKSSRKSPHEINCLTIIGYSVNRFQQIHRYNHYPDSKMIDIRNNLT